MAPSTSGQRERLIRVRRRQKAEREVAAICTGDGVSIDQARARQRAAADLLSEYDSGEDITPALLDSIRKSIIQRSAEGGHPLSEGAGRASQRQHMGQDHDYPQQMQGYLPQRQPSQWRNTPPPPRRSVAEERAPPPPLHALPAPSPAPLAEAQDAPSQRAASTPVHGDTWMPSNLRYGAASPRRRREDVVMPRRAAGEVDEWAAMVQVQEKLAVEGAQHYAQVRKDKQREYRESIQRQLDEKRSREEAARREKEGELARVKEEMARNQQIEIERREKGKEDAQRLRSMFEAQKADRQVALQEQRSSQMADEYKLLSAALEQQEAAEQQAAQAKEARRRQMNLMRQAVDAQVEERAREKAKMREIDRGYAEEYRRMMEEQEQRRRDAEAQRRARVGKLEIMGNDNAQRERQRQMAEDQRFLADLAQREAEAAEQAQRRQAAMRERRVQYKHDLDESVDQQRRREQREREAGQRAAVAAAQREVQAAAEAEAQERRDRQTRQQDYRDYLQAQMATDAEKRRHAFRMSDKERLLNRNSLDFYAAERGLAPPPRPPSERPLPPAAVRGAPTPLQVMHDFSYEDAFRAVSHHKGATHPSAAVLMPGGVTGGAMGMAGDAPELSRRQGQYADTLSFARGDVRHGGQVVLTHELKAPPDRGYAPTAHRSGGGGGDARTGTHDGGDGHHYHGQPDYGRHRQPPPQPHSNAHNVPPYDAPQPSHYAPQSSWGGVAGSRHGGDSYSRGGSRGAAAYYENGNENGGGYSGHAGEDGHAMGSPPRMGGGGAHHSPFGNMARKNFFNN